MWVSITSPETSIANLFNLCKIIPVVIKPIITRDRSKIQWSLDKCLKVFLDPIIYLVSLFFSTYCLCEIAKIPCRQKFIANSDDRILIFIILYY